MITAIDSMRHYDILYIEGLGIKMIKSNTKIMVDTFKTKVVTVVIYFTPTGYIAEINNSMQLGEACYDVQAVKDMVTAWSNKPLNMRGVMVDMAA